MHNSEPRPSAELVPRGELLLFSALQKVSKYLRREERRVFKVEAATAATAWIALMGQAASPKGKCPRPAVCVPITWAPSYPRAGEAKLAGPGTCETGPVLKTASLPMGQHPHTTPWWQPLFIISASRHPPSTQSSTNVCTSSIPSVSFFFSRAQHPR